MIRYKIYQNKQKNGVNAGKWFARAVCNETYDLDKLSEHMSGHNSPYSLGVIRGVFGKIGVCCYSGLAERNAEYHVNSIFYRS